MIEAHLCDGPWRRPALRRFAAVVAVPLLLGACSTVDDWFSDDEGPTKVAQNGAQAEVEAAEFPNLAGVPESAPSTTDAATRSRIKDSLAADRANAEYSGQLAGDNGAEGAGGATGAGMDVDRALAQARADQDAGLEGQTGAARQPSAPVPTPEPTATASESAAADTMRPATTEAAVPQFAPLPSALPQAAPARSELAGVIYFAHGSAHLNANDRQVLRGIAALNRDRDGSIRVVGHASARTGTADALKHRLANFEMSLKRANAVTAALVDLGVPRERIQTEARGDSQPVYHEFMPTGEAGNRRTEIFLEN
jgi:flagellar motor protein MotB